MHINLAARLLRPMGIQKRTSRLAGVLVALGLSFQLAPLAAHAEPAWPSRAIKMIVPFAAGGGADAVARAFATKLGSRLGQSVFVENRGGAGGALGIETVTTAPADGYTLLFASTSIATNAASGKKLSYDLKTDLQPIGGVAKGPLVIVVAGDVKAVNLREFIDLAKAKPNAVTYASAGVGSFSHLGVELFAAEAKVEMLHVPYKGLAAAFNDMYGGAVQMVLASPATAAASMASGKVRALAVTGTSRNAAMPQVPTTREAGLPGFQLEISWGLFGPAKMPPAIVARLNKELNAILEQPDYRELLAKESSVPTPGSPGALGNLIASDLDRWTALVKGGNIKLD